MSYPDRIESLIEARIKAAQRNGEFDNLPGAGKPLPGQNEPYDEDWWLKDFIRREGAGMESSLPPSLQLARTIEQLPEQIRKLPSEQRVREAVAKLNERIAAYRARPTAPFVSLKQVDPDDMAKVWHEALAARQGKPADGQAPQGGSVGLLSTSGATVLTKGLRSITLVTGLAALMLAATGAAASAGTTSSNAAACPSGALCLYEGTNFTGDMFPVTSLNPSGTCVSLVEHGWGDRAHSAVNTHNSSAAMFMNDDCLGGPYQVPANSSLPNFDTFTPESVWVPYAGS